MKSHAELEQAVAHVREELAIAAEEARPHLSIVTRRFFESLGLLGG